MKRMMKALVFPSNWKVELVETEVPRPGPSQVLAEIRCVGICGSDVDVDYWNAALDLIAGSGGKKLELDELITRRISLAEAVKAFEFYDRGEWIKILVEPFRE